MLTRRTAAISIAILAAGATVALDGAPASAGGGGGGGHRKGTSWIRTTTTTPRRAPTGGHAGGGGGSGKPAPMPCPAGAVCGQTTAGTAPAAQDAVPATAVALEARAKIQLLPPTVHTSPENKTYVRLRTGLWVEGFDHVDQPLELGGTTVVLHAEPKTVVWKTGEGTVTCENAGSRNGRTCGYTYAHSSAGQPNRRYAISATVNWYLSWECTGGLCDAAGGDWGDDSMESRTTDATLAVGEVQTESRPG
jgi:hypothetical protein